MRLVMPEHFSIYRFIGIDPGLNEAGVSIFDIDYQTSQILRIEALTLVNRHIRDLTGYDPESIDERVLKLMKMKMAFVGILQNTVPVLVASESPFFNRLRPTAYEPLVEVVKLFNSAILEYNPNIAFVTYPPLTVKSNVGAKSIKNDTEEGKKEMKRALSEIPEIVNALTTPLDNLSQHAIDATAVGYTALKSRRGI